MLNSPSASFATYNVLNPYYAVKWAEKPGLNEEGRGLSREELKASTAAQDVNAWMGYSNWDQRCPEIAQNIQLADVVCLQEVSKETLDALMSLTKGYRLAIAVYHAASRPMEQYGNAILYNAEKVRLRNAFELTYSPNQWSRSAACGVFEIGGKVVAVASMHLAGYYSGEANPLKKQESKKAGFNELKTYVEGLEAAVEGVDGIVIGGDFNEDPGEELLDLYRPGYLQRRGFLFDGNLAVTEPSKGRRIDWLCYKPLHANETVSLTSMGIEGVQKQASDHLMTGSVVEWRS